MPIHTASGAPDSGMVTEFVTEFAVYAQSIVADPQRGVASAIRSGTFDPWFKQHLAQQFIEAQRDGAAGNAVAGLIKRLERAQDWESRQAAFVLRWAWSLRGERRAG